MTMKRREGDDTSRYEGKGEERGGEGGGGGEVNWRENCRPGESAEETISPIQNNRGRGKRRENGAKRRQKKGIDPLRGGAKSRGARWPTIR